MAYVQTYTSLVEAIKTTFYRLDSDDDFSASIPRFIRLAELRLGTEFKQLGLIKFVQGVLTQDNPRLQKPSRWRETVSFKIGTGVGYNTQVQIIPRSYEYITSVYPDATASNQPRFFADKEFNYFYIGPTPDVAYPYELGYYETMLPLDETNQTNWFTANQFDLLQFACFSEAAGFLKDEEMKSTYETQYMQRLQANKIEDDRRISDRAITVKE